MKYVIIILISIVVSTVWAQSREASKKVIMEGCVKNGRQLADKTTKSCECIANNLVKNQRLSMEDLAILAKVYSSADPEKTVMAYETKGLLFTYDTETAENCVKDPRWKVASEASRKE
jgi:hypothetical protein